LWHVVVERTTEGQRTSVRVDQGARRGTPHVHVGVAMPPRTSSRLLEHAVGRVGARGTATRAIECREQLVEERIEDFGPSCRPVAPASKSWTHAAGIGELADARGHVPAWSREAR
jgi:hypothetical protein